VLCLLGTAKGKVLHREKGTEKTMSTKRSIGFRERLRDINICVDAINGIVQDSGFVDAKEILYLPDTLFTKLGSFRKRRIDIWPDIESASRMIEYGEVEDLFFGNIRNDIAMNPSCLLVTDESIDIEKCFQLKSHEMIEFIPDYEDYFDTTFLQPMDYLLVIPQLNHIFSIFHEGYIFEWGNV